MEAIHRATLEYLSYNANVIFHLQNETENPTGQSGCINSRDVFRDAVFVALGNAARGAVVGALGGTVVLPGIGTIAGAVGVGIWGLFTGYMSHAAWSLAYQWFFKCLMQSPQQDPGGNCDNLDFYLMNPEYCDFDRHAPELRWFLTGNN